MLKFIKRPTYYVGRFFGLHPSMTSHLPLLRGPKLNALATCQTHLVLTL